MPKFRKKPIVIEAIRVLATNYNGVDWDGFPFSDNPEWLAYAMNDGLISVEPSETDYAIWRVGALEDGPNKQANHIAIPGDWIIRGTKGELYPCTPDIFDATYEPVT